LPSGDFTFDVVNFQDVTGTQADDIITGNELDNILDGQAGNDLFFGTFGNDTITGGTGSDTVDYSNLAGSVTIKPTGFIEKDGGLLGVDKVSAEEIIGNADYINVIDASSSTTASLDVDLFNNSLKVLGTTVGNLSFEVQNFSNVIGSQVGDIIRGNSGNNNLRGEGGNDTLIGGAGADVLNGGIGTDTVSYLGSNSGVTVNLATGIGSGGDATGDSFISIENATGSAFNDNLTGNNLNNILSGGSGNDNLNGGAGNDSIFGELGNDVLIGGLGADTLDGGAGIDTASYATATAAVTVNLTTGNGTLGEANGDRLIAIENLTGSRFNDNLTGNIGNNTLTGNNGNDTLNGGAGNDILLGGAGNDLLIGGLGNDILTGGVGLDNFQFNSSTEGIDRITDFSVVDDTISILSSGFGGLTVGTLSATAFVIGSAATNFSQRFIYNNTNGGLFFDRDGVGTSFNTVQIATLNSGLSLTNADFQIV
jgi:Ca2+-binding RTX toxin-like protein